MNLVFAGGDPCRTNTQVMSIEGEASVTPWKTEVPALEQGRSVAMGHLRGRRRLLTAMLLGWHPHFGFGLNNLDATLREASTPLSCGPSGLWRRWP